VKFGVFDHLDDDGRDIAQQYEGRLRLAEACEEVGFYAYHVAEHHGTPHGNAPSPNLFLSAMSQRTRRLRFGPLVMLLNLYHPLRAFEEICMLDQMSGGRVELGIGRGAVPIELAFFGVSAEEAQQRYLEAGSVILSAMAGGRLNHQGRYFNISEVPISLTPVQRPHPPLWYGTNRPETAALAAENGINIASYGTASSVRAVSDSFRARWVAKADHQSAMPFIGMTRHIVVAETDADARKMAAQAYARWFATLTHLWRQNDIVPPPTLPTTFEEAMEGGHCLAGSVSSVRDEVLRQIKASGINYLLCQVAFGDLTTDASCHSAAAIGKEIMPAVDEASR
jgi:alkanesulfonate monooxygenase SsuD/methylene tetrahydromethanopterin reductase-like flavin-dependent oxidoreductase (luciferase family)